MGLSPSIRSAEIADQQQSISDPAQLAFSESGFPYPIIMPKETAIRLYCWKPSWTRSGSDNWIYAGKTKGFHRIRRGYSTRADSRKMVFVKLLISNAQALLSRPVLEPNYRIGGPRIMLSAQHMKSLPDFFANIPDPRRAQGRRHRLPTVLAIATAATLCGMRGYLAISDWANSLGQKARERFGCRYENRRYIVPSLSIIRDVLISGRPKTRDFQVGEAVMSEKP